MVSSSFKIPTRQYLINSLQQSLPKVTFIGTHTKNENYLLKMASTMATFGYQIDFILVKDNHELMSLQTPFKVNVIGNYFRWSTLQSLWMYSKIMWYTIRNIRSRCIYVVEDVCLVPLFKLLGNKVAYYKKDISYNSTMDTIIGNVFLSNVDLILIPTQSERLHFEKIAVVSPFHASSGVDAIKSLLYKSLPKRICTVWMENKFEELQGERESPNRSRNLEIIREEHENGGEIQNVPEAENELSTEDTDKGPSRTESEMGENADISTESEAIANENEGAGIKDEGSEKRVTPTSETTDESLPSLIATDNIKPFATTIRVTRNFCDIFRDVNTATINHSEDGTDETLYADQFENISAYFVPLQIGVDSSDLNEFQERERVAQEEDGDSEVGIVNN